MSGMREDDGAPDLRVRVGRRQMRAARGDRSIVKFSSCLPLRDELPVLGLGPLEPDVARALGQHRLELAQEATVLLADLTKDIRGVKKREKKVENVISPRRKRCPRP